MPLETATYISDLNTSNPSADDYSSQGDDHIRLIKAAIKNSFTGIAGAVTASHTALNAAAALQPSGAGPVIVPAVAGVAEVDLVGVSGTSGTVKVTASSGVLSVAITDTAGANPVTVLSVDRNGTLKGKGGTVLSFVGEIRLWSGAISAIPTGWALCDGTNGTPDLRDKFVMGAGTTAVGSTGGAASVTLTVGQLPSHSHAINDPGHIHGIVDPGHTHPINDPGHIHGLLTLIQNVQSGATFAIRTLSTATVGGIVTDTSYTGVSVSSAATGISANTATTGITATQNAGSGNAVPTRPPFLALAYIMRIT